MCNTLFSISLHDFWGNWRGVIVLLADIQCCLGARYSWKFSDIFCILIWSSWIYTMWYEICMNKYIRICLFYSLFYSIPMLFLSQRRKQRRKRRRETLMMKHLKRAMMVMRRDVNSIISPIHRIGSSCLSTFLLLWTIASAHRQIFTPLIQVQDVEAKNVIPKFTVSCLLP
jgi:hypothetical protein